MNVYVCLECCNLYNRENLKEINDQFTCPMRDCAGSVVELDEMIAPTIMTLNQKGYITVQCCAGHIDRDMGYIWFYEDESPHIYPEGIYRFPHEPEHMIRWNFETRQFSGDRILEIAAFHKKLLEWANSLEAFEENFDEGEDKANDDN